LCQEIKSKVSESSLSYLFLIYKRRLSKYSQNTPKRSYVGGLAPAQQQTK